TGSHTLNNLTFDSVGSGTNARVLNIASGTTLTVNGTFTISGSTRAAINTGAIHVIGDMIVTNTYTGSNGGGTTAIHINGTEDQELVGPDSAGMAILPPITINKSSGTLSLSGV